MTSWFQKIADERSRIAVCAYQLWLREGRPAGRAEEHWALAEEEVRRSQTLDEPDCRSAPRIAQTDRLARRRRPRPRRLATLHASAPR